MNKKIILVGALLLLIAGGYFMFTKSSKNSPDTSGQSANSAPKSLKDLLTAGVAQKCTFSMTQESGNQSGTTYITNGKLRGDFTSQANGKTMETHMIVSGNTSYVWQEGEKEGFKSSFDPSTSVSGSEAQSASTTASLDFNKQGDYKCSAWVVDESMFTPPSDVKFNDFSQLMKPTTSGTGQGESSQCSVCDSLSGDDKTQCRTALSCK